VLDFGLARINAETIGPEAPSATALTAPGMIAGTPHYMAPEQIEGGPDEDSRADIFAFGCVLYEMVTGKRAFEGPTAASAMAAVLEREPPLLSEIGPPALVRLLKRCLAKDPEARYQSVRDLRADLEWAATESTAGKRAEPAKPRTAWLPWAAAAALALALAAGIFLRFHHESAARATNLSLAVPEGNVGRYVSLSPDGRTLGCEALCAIFSAAARNPRGF